MKDLKDVMNALPVERRTKIDACAGELFAEEMTHNSHKLKLKGESMRKIMSKMTDSDHS
jgi:hypothetical protein